MIRRHPRSTRTDTRLPYTTLFRSDEMAYARAARPPVGAGLVARTILDHGTRWQHEAFLTGARSAADGFSLGYSEPEAGSDLTGLRTRARLDGDTYVVSGEKRWTSDAHTARWLWLLCRTGPPAARRAGLPFLVVDLRSEGRRVGNEWVSPCRLRVGPVH